MSDLIMFLKKTFFASLIPVLLTGLLVISCDQPANGSDPVNAKAPAITGQPQGGTWDVSEDDEFTLAVTANSTDGGELSYQWYENTTNSATGGTPIGTDNPLTLDKKDYDVDKDYYFYVEVTNTITDNGDGGTKTASAASSVVKVTVKDGYVPPTDAEEPEITGQPEGGTWNVGSASTLSLTVTASVTDGGSLSYQWYSNTTGSTVSGNAVAGGTNATLTLAKADYEFNAVYYFYAVVTNTNNNAAVNKTVTATSNAAMVTVTGGSSVILIYTPEDMAKIGVVNTHPLSGKYLLMNDITLANWMPAGNATTPFTGVFSGGGNKITLNSFSGTALSDIYIGIFGDIKGASVSAKAEIKNLTIQSSVNATTTPSASQTVGLLTGRAELAVIENITLTGTFAYNSTIVNYLGGIAGQINSEGTLVKNINSSLNMDIVPAGSGYNYIGGIAGRFQNGTGIENCHNTGNITADNAASTAAGQVFVGGIAGGSNYAMSTTYHGYIKDSSFTGTVIGRSKGQWTFVGGIAGTTVGGNVNNNQATTRVERCFVSGTVSNQGDQSGFPYIGGVVAYNYYGAMVSQSYFSGTINSGGTKNPFACGGVVGYHSQITAPNNSRVEECYSSGTANINNGARVVGTTAGSALAPERCYTVTGPQPQTYYAGWDFTNVWIMGADGYPKLRRQQL